MNNMIASFQHEIFCFFFDIHDQMTLCGSSSHVLSLVLLGFCPFSKANDSWKHIQIILSSQIMFIAFVAFQLMNLLHPVAFWP